MSQSLALNLCGIIHRGCVKNKSSSDGKRELTNQESVPMSGNEKHHSQSPRAAAASAEVHLHPCHHKSTEGQSKSRGRGGPAV